MEAGGALVLAVRCAPGGGIAASSFHTRGAGTVDVWTGLAMNMVLAHADRRTWTEAR